MDWPLIITMAIIGTIVGFGVGRKRGRPKPGVTLGFRFGLIGVLAIWLIPRAPQAQQEYLATGRVRGRVPGGRGAALAAAA
jgi:hypothetical protein